VPVETAEASVIAAGCRRRDRGRRGSTTTDEEMRSENRERRVAAARERAADVAATARTRYEEVEEEEAGAESGCRWWMPTKPKDIEDIEVEDDEDEEDNRSSGKWKTRKTMSADHRSRIAKDEPSSYFFKPPCLSKGRETGHQAGLHWYGP